VQSTVPEIDTYKPVWNFMASGKNVAGEGVKVFAKIVPDAAVLSHTLIVGVEDAEDTQIPITVPAPVLIAVEAEMFLAKPAS
jgi:hypothetical protein